MKSNLSITISFMGHVFIVKSINILPISSPEDVLLYHWDIWVLLRFLSFNKFGEILPVPPDLAVGHMTCFQNISQLMSHLYDFILK